MKGANIDSLLATYKTSEAWGIIHQCYRHAKYQPPPTTRKGLETSSANMEDLYRQQSPEGYLVPILMRPEEIPDEPLVGGEIAVALIGLRTQRADRQSGIQVEHLKVWLR